MAFYAQKHLPAADGLTPDDPSWLLAFGHRTARAKAVRHELDGLLFCLDCAQRAVFNARGLRKERNRRFARKAGT